MVWAPWEAGHCPIDPAGFPVAPWTHMVSHIPDINRRVRLALPCIGLDGLSAGLMQLNWNHFEIIYGFDVDPELASALVHLHGPQGVSNLQVGRAGNILDADIVAWERVDFVIAGPPCPPPAALACGDKTSIRERQSSARSQRLYFIKGTWGAWVSL